jgi:hypothetical protein
MTTSAKTPAPETPEPPAPSFLKRVENATFDKAGELLGIPRKPKAARFAVLSPAQEEQLRKIETTAIADFQGDITQLEAALGMLRMGHHFGWKVLYLIHSKKTVRNYEAILSGDSGDVRIRDLFPEIGPSAYRSFGLQLANKFSNFWKVVAGEIRIPRRKDVAG